MLQFHPTNNEIGTCTYVSLCVFIAPNFSVLDGQAHQKFFRKDYTFLEDAQGFYKIHTIHKTWQDAKKQCQMEGASLFYAEDEIEADAVQSLWNRTQPQFAWVYVGISDLLAKGVFETIDGQYIITISLLWELPIVNPLCIEAVPWNRRLYKSAYMSDVLMGRTLIPNLLINLLDTS